ncbi:hypothetical protein [Coprobacillus sp. AF33-1AC]|uniref:hypothetical protein n=1 Tax=Coprobacillus sp. AF33-1AC TaxID=2292032 RepID=UPI000E4D24EC|nr:hypothetical protein [Coprobacillus sp. AF33-1AC]RHM59656.1 hypothetical protein DWZ53_08920 [Coprobacillus sp. AF33-1AC]
MSKKFEVVLNSAGVQALLKSDEMMNICEKHANDTVKAAGGSGYSISTRVGRTRCNAQIEANTIKSILDNNKNNTLLKSLR